MRRPRVSTVLAAIAVAAAAKPWRLLPNYEREQNLKRLTTSFERGLRSASDQMRAAISTLQDLKLGTMEDAEIVKAVRAALNPMIMGGWLDFFASEGRYGHPAWCQVKVEFGLCDDDPSQLCCQILADMEVLRRLHETLTNMRLVLITQVGELALDSEWPVLHFRMTTPNARTIGARLAVRQIGDACDANAATRP